MFMKYFFKSFTVVVHNIKFPIAHQASPCHHAFVLPAAAVARRYHRERFYIDKDLQGTIKADRHCPKSSQCGKTQNFPSSVKKTFEKTAYSVNN